MDERFLYRALADGRRRRIVAELRLAGAGLDAQELARRLGLHPNTVRWHLGILADAGLIASKPAASGTRGRPRILYRLVHEPSVPAAADEHRLLASALAGAMSRIDGGAAAAVEAGRAWGRYLVRRPEPLVAVSEAEAVAEVVDVLATQGFEPEVEGREISMYRCPFHDLAVSHGDVVCGMHRGLIGGALAELGGELDLETLEAFARPGVCVARLRRRQGAAAGPGATARTA